jgi:hypothetical protein
MALAGCDLGGSTPSPGPSVRTEGQNVKCPTGDHGTDEGQFGWSFCRPATWKMLERLQPSTAPKGVDVTFDVVNDVPRGTPGSGDFGFMIIGTYDRAGAATLKDWVTSNAPSAGPLTTITWANAAEAGQAADGRRYALTAAHVVELDVRGEPIAAEMSKRLDTWKFSG